MAGNSTYKLQILVDDAFSLGDCAPALTTGGFASSVALSMAQDVMTALLLGGPNGQPFNWKWNRFNVPSFPTISLQQDYFVPGVVNLGWMEYCWAVNINQTSIPKQKQDLEVKRDLQVTFNQTGNPGKICWLPNDQMNTGTWGQTALASPSGLNNPGPGVVYVNPIGTSSQPNNPTTCITDAFGNLWNLTTFGTCGNTNPFLSNLNPVFPTYNNPTQVATTATDGTCVWTAINPKGQGFRLNPIPPLTGITWEIQPVCQMRIPVFKSLTQTLEPVPDDYVSYFKQGFFTQCRRRNPDPKVYSRFSNEWQLWLASLDKAVKSGQREQDDMGFYPTVGVMDSGWGFSGQTPSRPYGPWSS